MIPRKQFDAYNESVARLSGGAAAQVEAEVLAYCSANPDATVAECREFAKASMAGAVQVYGEAASALAAEWYDAQADGSGRRLPSAVTSAVYVPEKVDEVARYQARKLASGDVRGFARACGEYASNDVLRSLNETIIENVGRDKGEGVRFARVPTGAETCSFCYMLSSRGAVYHSRKTAGEFKHFHRRCDCKVVPGFEADQDAEIVEGYDPKGMRERMALIEEQTGLKFGDGGDMSALSREMGLRDARWLMDGTIPKPEYESEEAKAFKFKNKRSTEDHKKELETARILAESGFDAIFVIDEKIDEASGKTIGLADLKSGLEIKTLNGATSENTINGHLKNASKKSNSTAVVFDNSKNDLSDRGLIRMILGSRSFKRGSVYIIDKEKKIKKIR